MMSSAQLRLMSDLKAIRQEPPELAIAGMEQRLPKVNPRPGQAVPFPSECSALVLNKRHYVSSRRRRWLHEYNIKAGLFRNPSSVWTPTIAPSRTRDCDGVTVVLNYASVEEESQTDIGCSASPHGDENLFVWGATIFGPDETPWEGGIFSLRLIFGEHYPEKPPRVRFTSDVFHPNVYSDGTLCMDIIQDAWSPCHNICTILTSIQSLLTDPNPASPANPEAAQLYQNDIISYNRRVRLSVRKSVDSSS